MKATTISEKLSKSMSKKSEIYRPKTKNKLSRFMNWKLNKRKKRRKLSLTGKNGRILRQTFLSVVKL